jgi:hypothetical protein
MNQFETDRASYQLAAPGTVRLARMPLRTLFANSFCLHYFQPRVYPERSRRASTVQRPEPNRHKTKLNPIQLIENKQRRSPQIATKSRFFAGRCLHPGCLDSRLRCGASFQPLTSSFQLRFSESGGLDRSPDTGPLELYSLHEMTVAKPQLQQNTTQTQFLPATEMHFLRCLALSTFDCQL